MGSVSAILTATTLAACAKPPEPVAPARPVLVAQVGVAGDEAGLVTGQVRSTASHDLAAEAGGRVVRIAADVGDRVRAGQVLIEFDSEPAKLMSREATARALAAKADLVRAQDEARRQVRMADAGATSTAALVAARTEAEAARQRHEAAEAQADLAARNASRMVLRAPIDGVVSARQVQLSSVVAQGAPLISIEGAGALEIWAPAPSAVLARLRPGAAVPFRIGEVQGLAQLEGVSPRAAGVDARLVRFRILSGPAVVGAVAELDLRGARDAGRDARVPLSAVVTERTGASHVFVVEAGRLKAAPVRLVSVDNAGARVRGALKPGQSVVAAGAELLSAGEPVRPLPHAF